LSVTGDTVDSPVSPEPPEVADDGLRGGLRGDPSLAQDMKSEVRAFAEAELAFQKARAAYAGSAAGVIAGLGIVAAVLLFFATMAVIFGTVIALSPTLGAWGAMAAVSLALLALAAICALLALMRFRRMKAVLGQGESDDKRG
jgi:uncharacterized membrane protein YqjE